MLAAASRGGGGGGDGTSTQGPKIKQNLLSLLGDGIFNADGPAWHTQRKTASFLFAAENLRGCDVCMPACGRPFGMFWCCVPFFFSMRACAVCLV